MDNITTLLFDVGGIVLTNGWGHVSREKAAKHFGYDYEASEERHQQIAYDFECGRITLSDYLKEVVFFQHRPFTEADFIHFMENESQPHPTSIDVLQRLVAQNKYLLATVNNESLHLNLYRIQTFKLTHYFHAFFSSCFLGVTKPDCEIFQKTLHITQRKQDECLFIDDREENVIAARQCGLRAAYLPQPQDLADILQKNNVLL